MVAPPKKKPATEAIGIRALEESIFIDMNGLLPFTYNGWGSSSRTIESPLRSGKGRVYGPIVSPLAAEVSHSPLPYLSLSAEFEDAKGGLLYRGQEVVGG